MTRAERAQQLWSILVLAATNRQILTYSIVEKATGLFRPAIGDNLRPIQQHCTEKQLPALTSIIVAEDGLPGRGFIAAQVIPGEQIRVFAYTWLDVRAPTAEELEAAYSRAPDAR